MKLFADQWFEDVKDKWIVDTNQSDEYIYCYYVLEHKIDGESYSWRGFDNPDKYFVAVQVMIDQDKKILRANMYTDLDFATLSGCAPVGSNEMLEKLNSSKEVAKVFLNQ
mgnify:CR=1 FL=1